MEENMIVTIEKYLDELQEKTVRVRQRGINGSYTYSKTRKINVNDIKRIEIETRLSSDEYINELTNADTSCGQIRKTRYCLSYKNQYFEIDIYPFWNDKAICEIELLKEDQLVELPDFLKVREEITENKNYKNRNIASLIKSI